MALSLPAVDWADATLDGHVLDVVLCGTGSGNRLGPAFWDEAPGFFAALDHEDDIRAVLLRGAGARFSTGLDLTAMAHAVAPVYQQGTSARARRGMLDVILGMQAATLSVALCRKPIVAAIHGHCIGGAIDLVAACDVRLATTDAVLSVKEAAVGIVADLGTLFWLPRIVGQGHARELAYTAKDLSGTEAARIGLVNRALADEAALLADARATCAAIAANAPLVVEGTKEMLNRDLVSALRSHLTQVATWNTSFLPTQDLQEAVTAFFEKRAPAYTGD